MHKREHSDRFLVTKLQVFVHVVLYSIYTPLLLVLRNAIRLHNRGSTQSSSRSGWKRDVGNSTHQTWISGRSPCSTAARIKETAFAERGLIETLNGSGWLQRSKSASSERRMLKNAYLMTPLVCATVGVTGIPFLTTFSIEYVASNDAVAMNTVASATCMPGHELQSLRQAMLRERKLGTLPPAEAECDGVRIHFSGPLLGAFVPFGHELQRVLVRLRVMQHSPDIRN